MQISTIFLAVALCLPAAAKESVVLVHTKEGTTSEVRTGLASIRVTVDGKARTIPLAGILSVHNGDAPSTAEASRIADGIAAIQGPDRKARDLALEALTAIGVPVASPLLKTYKDTDQHEPRPLYRLFERVMPSQADQLDRGLSIIRLSSGEALRAKVEPMQLGELPWDRIRFFAVKQRTVTRRIDIHSIRHCTQIEFLDTAIYLAPDSKATIAASGFTRLSWDVDGWATDPNGLQKPGPNYKTNLVDGHPFGALVGRLRAAGEIFFVGRQWTAKPGAEGKLFLAINDNRHWQNNLGSYRAVLQTTNSYDIGDPQ
jgi:hypothetical protein